MIDLEAIFGGRLLPEVPLVHDDDRLDDHDHSESCDWLAEHEADGFVQWVRRQDARGVWGWERVDLPGGVADWELCLELDWDCPTCGGLLWWEDFFGGRHCLTCERDGHERAQRLAERAARLRSRTAPQRPVSGDAMAQSDQNHVDNKQPSEAILAGSGGCQDGQPSDTMAYGEIRLVDSVPITR